VTGAIVPARELRRDALKQTTRPGSKHSRLLSNLLGRFNSLSGAARSALSVIVEASLTRIKLLAIALGPRRPPNSASQTASRK
jgi:hypothetical protein